MSRMSHNFRESTSIIKPSSIAWRMVATYGGGAVAPVLSVLCLGVAVKQKTGIR